MNASAAARAPAVDALAQLAERPLDALVVGGGIVGAGVARDAALRGLRVGLVEQRDFASGTSSRSSRLLHGGLRYLAQGRVGLVWEASREKTVLRRIAPHLWQSLEFIFPTRRRSGWPRWKLAVGVRVYDLLCGLGQGGGSGSLGAADTLRRVPGLEPAGLTGAVRYHDALTNDARLVLDTLASARRHGAMACNYAKLLDARPDGAVWRCEVEDAASGARVSIAARSVVNAAGPWSDRLPPARTTLRLTKGVHLVVERRRLPVADAVVLAQGSRILFVIPWGERVILGTTDTDYQGELEEPPCEAVDVAYILDVVNDAFPAARLTAEDLVSTWSGLRPLVADARGRPSDISRRHRIAMSHPGWWDVTGGKLTTYRLMAEETVDSIVRHLGISAPACRTAAVPLLADPPPSNQEAGERIEPLLDVGAAGSGILPPPVSEQAVRHYCREESARRVEDVMLRRTSWRHYYRNHLELAENVARWMAPELGWAADRTAAELADYRGLTGAVAAAPPEITAGRPG